MNISATRIVIPVLIVVMVASMLYAWYRPPQIEVQREYQRVPVPVEVQKIKRMVVPVERVVVIEKEAAAKVYDLSPRVINSPHLEVAAIGEIPATPDGAKVVAVLDKTTGEIEIEAKALPRPLMAFENSKEIGVRYGLDTAAGGMTGTVFGRWTFARIGAAYFSVYGEINQYGPAKALAEVSYRF